MGQRERIYSTPRTEWIWRLRRPDHWARYEFAARRLIQGKILDVACGCGYGTAYLRENFHDGIVGIDISKEAIQHAQKYYPHAGIFHEVSDPPWEFEDSSFTSVVSLETLEHVARPEQFLLEIYRILKPGGVLILSTPVNYGKPGKSDNIYHLREYMWAELEEMIKKSGYHVTGHWSQVPKIAKMWVGIGGGNSNTLAIRAKQKFPKSWVKCVRSVLTLFPGMKYGNFMLGHQQGAAVQLIIAEKLGIRNEMD